MSWAFGSLGFNAPAWFSWLFFAGWLPLSVEMDYRSGPQSWCMLGDVAFWCVGVLLLRCVSDSCDIRISLLQLHNVSHLLEVWGSGSNPGGRD